MLEQKVVDLTTNVAKLTEAITTHHISGAGDLEKLTRDRRNADEELADAKRALPLLRERIIKDTQNLARVRAADRMLGLKRAFGSLVKQMDLDEVKCREAGAQCESAVDQLNERFRSIRLLQAEASALADRFAIAPPQFSPVVVPAQRNLVFPATVVLSDHGRRAPSTEEDEFGQRRRDYLEVQGTEAAQIIAMVGPKDFPPVDPAVQAAHEREQRQEIEFSKRMAAEVDPTRPPLLPQHIR